MIVFWNFNPGLMNGKPFVRKYLMGSVSYDTDVDGKKFYQAEGPGGKLLIGTAMSIASKHRFRLENET